MLMIVYPIAIGGQLVIEQLERNVHAGLGFGLMEVSKHGE